MWPNLLVLGMLRLDWGYLGDLPPKEIGCQRRHLSTSNWASNFGTSRTTKIHGPLTSRSGHLVEVHNLPYFLLLCMTKSCQIWIDFCFQTFNSMSTSKITSLVFLVKVFGNVIKLMQSATTLVPFKLKYIWGSNFECSLETQLITWCFKVPLLITLIWNVRQDC